MRMMMSALMYDSEMSRNEEGKAENCINYKKTQ